MKNTNLTVATTILSQLGGGRFIMMTGAKALTAHAAALSFRLPGGGGFTKNGINYVKVQLNAKDTYDVTFSRIRAGKVTTVAYDYDIYCDQLQDVFTRETGLAVRL